MFDKHLDVMYSFCVDYVCLRENLLRRRFLVIKWDQYLTLYYYKFFEKKTTDIVFFSFLLQTNYKTNSMKDIFILEKSFIYLSHDFSFNQV